MGLFGRKRSTRVEGRGVVVGLAPTERGARQVGKRDVEHTVRLRVEAAGRPTGEVDVVDDVPSAKTPLLGDVLAVEVDPDDPNDVRIDWDRAPDLVTRSMGSAAAVRRGDVAGAAEALGFTLRDDPPG
jgi:hypothetical protein